MCTHIHLNIPTTVDTCAHLHTPRHICKQLPTLVHTFVHSHTPAHTSTQLEVERTVRCLQTVWLLVMFERFKVSFLAKITCSDMFEVRFSWFWKKLGPIFINKVREQFGFWWCSRGLKFGFGPKWDVRMCSKFDPLRFGMFEGRFFDVRSTSSIFSWVLVLTVILASLKIFLTQL